MREIINKRKERERHILNDDGSITAEIYDRDIFYLDKGKYKECDDTIVDSGKIFENKTNKIKTMFSKEEVRYALLLDPVNENIYFQLANIELSRGNKDKAVFWIEEYLKGPKEVNNPAFLKFHKENKKANQVLQQLKRG